MKPNLLPQSWMRPSWKWSLYNVLLVLSLSWPLQARSARGWRVLHQGLPVNIITFAPNGSLLACGTGGPDSTLGVVKIWNVSSGKQVRILRGLGDFVSGVAFSPDGKLLAASSGGHLADTSTVDTTDFKTYGEFLLYDVGTGKLLYRRRGHSDLATSVSFSRDGKMIVTGSVDGTVKVWDVATGDLRQTLYSRHKDSDVWDIAFSPDGQVLAAACSYNAFEDAGSGEVLMWDTHKWKLMRVLSEGEHTTSDVEFSRDGQLLAATIHQPADAELAAGAVRVWDVRTGKRLRTLRVGRGDINTISLAFSPDGRTLVSGSGGGVYDPHYKPGLIRVWDVRTGRLRLTLRRHRDCVSNLAFSPTGLILASASWDSTVRLWKFVQ